MPNPVSEDSTELLELSLILEDIVETLVEKELIVLAVLILQTREFDRILNTKGLKRLRELVDTLRNAGIVLPLHLRQHGIMTQDTFNRNLKTLRAKIEVHFI